MAGSLRSRTDVLKTALSREQCVDRLSAHVHELDHLFKDRVIHGSVYSTGATLYRSSSMQNNLRVATDVQFAQTSGGSLVICTSTLPTLPLIITAAFTIPLIVVGLVRLGRGDLPGGGEVALGLGLVWALCLAVCGMARSDHRDIVVFLRRLLDAEP